MRIVAVVAFLLIPVAVFSQVLMLYGGQSHEVFLGCLNTNKYDTNSIWNRYGTYGSRYSGNSIWNRYGPYGSRYSAYSPWNSYTSTPPAIVDEDGNFYGYFTTNRRMPRRTTINWVLWILDNYEWISEDTGEAYDMLFR